MVVTQFKPPQYETSSGDVQLALFDELRDETRSVSPLQHPHEIGTVTEDRMRFTALNTPGKRSYHLYDVMESVSDFRCLRDLRIIYNIELSVMAELIGTDEKLLETCETPEVCQFERPQDEYWRDVINDVRRLAAILDHAGYGVDEVGPIITHDLPAIAKMIQRGRISTFLTAFYPSARSTNRTTRKK